MLARSLLLVASTLAAPAKTSTLPPSFEPNQGQGAAEAAAFARGPGFVLALRPDGNVLRLESHSVVTTLVAARASAPLLMSEPLPSHSSYFRGPAEAGGTTRIPHFASAAFSEVWPGIDLIYHRRGGALEYDFVVAPGASPGVIKLDFDGVDSLTLTPEGDLLLCLGERAIRQLRPIAYQDRDGQRLTVSASWVIDSRGRAGFAVGDHDRDTPLVIDPVLSFASYLGGSGFDQTWAIATDAAGYVYVAGETLSLDFPLQGPAQPARGGGADAFVSKIDPFTPALQWSTYLGGNGDEVAYSIAVDAGGQALVAGQSWSSNFPTTALALQQSSAGLNDAFVTLFDASGSALVFSTLLGGSRNDYGFGAGWDGRGGILVAGSTESADWPALNPLQPALSGLVDAFVARLSSNGSSLLFSTWFGGSDDDQTTALAVAANGVAIIAGPTRSSDLPLLAPIQASYGGGTTDIYLARIDPGTATLLSSTYLGGTGLDRSQSLALDPAGNILIAGESDSSDFPLQGALRTTAQGVDGVAVRLAPDASSLLYSTYLGGSSYDSALAIAGDALGNIYAAGRTDSTDFPQVAALQPGFGGGGDAFALKIDPSGTALAWSSWIGGSDSDDLVATTVDGSGNSWFSGRTISVDHPTVSPLQGALAGDYDATLVSVADGSCALPRPVGNSLELVRQGSNVFARWANVLNASEYRLYQSASRDWSSPMLLQSASDGPTGITRALPSGPLALWGVSAANACGESPR